MSKRGDARLIALRQRLRDLAGEPTAQQALAVEILAAERSLQVVPVALAVLGSDAPPGARPILHTLYDYYDADGLKRDSRGPVRRAILDALLPLASQAEVPLAARAVATYEFLPPTREESTGDVRAAGLRLLHAAQAEATSYAAVRLLHDPYTMPMSGQPAVTAVEVLADAGQLLPLYALLVQEGAAGAEVQAECLRQLTAVPPVILAELVARFQETPDDLVLTGLFDLLLGHPAGATYAPYVADFLQTTRRYNAYHYLVTTILAGRQSPWLGLLLQTARTPGDAQQRALLIAAFTPLAGDPVLGALLATLQR